MAKKGVQDIRVDFIESIGKTDNLRVLRSICDDIYKRRTVFNISKSDVEKMFNEGFERMESLLGSQSDAFAPVVLMREWGVMSYFNAIKNGYKAIETTEVESLKLIERKAEYEEKSLRLKNKGKLDKAEEFDTYLEIFKNPEFYAKKYSDLLENLELKKAEIDYDVYEEHKKLLKKYVKEANTALKIVLSKREQKSAPKDIQLVKEDILKKFSMDKPMALYIGIGSSIRCFFGYEFLENTKEIEDTYVKYFSAYNGDYKLDYKHMLILYNVLKRDKYERLNEVEAVLIYTILEHIALNILPYTMEYMNIFIRSNPTEFHSEKLGCYTYRYSASYLLPEGYRGYIFEPKNLNQQSFISAIDRTNLDVDTMVGKYKEAQAYMKARKNGVLFDFLDKDLENRLLPDLITTDFSVQCMQGDYGKLLLEELIERRNQFGDGESSNVLSNMYMRVVKPYNLEVLGSYVRTFCNKLSLLRDKDMIYIYYVSPQRIAIAVRNDVDEDMLSEVFEEQFIKNLTEVKVPNLEDFISGECL